MLVINHNSITDAAGIVPKSRCTGSSCWYHDGDNIYRKKKRVIPPEISGNVYKRYLTILGYCSILGLRCDPDTIDQVSPRFKGFGRNILNYRVLRNSFDSAPSVKRRSYRINGKQIKRRAVALSRLSESKRHLAFFSISFPAGADDAVLYEIWNRWLTTCRRHHGLTTYVWVAERQQNGTLHYHMLTNNWLDISKVNAAMATSINTSVHQGKLTWGQSSHRLYNGVDVDSIHRPKRRQNESRFAYRERLRRVRRYTKADRVSFAIKYLTKYITKQDEIFTRQPWHCSRDISQLFTSELVSNDDLDHAVRYVSDIPDDYEIYSRDHYTIYVFKSRPGEQLFRNIDELNEQIYSMYHTRGDPDSKIQNNESNQDIQYRIGECDRVRRAVPGNQQRQGSRFAAIRQLPCGTPHGTVRSLPGA